MNNIDLISEMLSIQDAVNTNVDSDWMLKNREWYRAGWVESAELMDSLDWKWWKHQTDNLDNARIEIVDIWHFILAKCVESNVSADVIDSHWRNNTTEDRLVTVDRLAFTLLKMKFEGASIVAVVDVFSQICCHMGLSIKEIYLFYIGKATLNNFRQNHGYKEGIYNKHWAPKDVDGDGHPVEDNDFLTEILMDYMTVDSLPDNLSYVIYSRLKASYPLG